MMSSKSCEWETPRDVFEDLEKEFHFEIDVAATTKNSKCKDHFDKTLDGLLQRWSPRVCWMNPPYGPDLRLWMRKAYQEAIAGATVVCLVPARTDTYWWHDYAMKGEIRFIRGRLRFNNGNGRATFPSAVVIFRPLD